jgi:hypothetical protein
LNVSQVKCGDQPHEFHGRVNRVDFLLEIVHEFGKIANFFTKFPFYLLSPEDLAPTVLVNLWNIILVLIFIVCEGIGSGILGFVHVRLMI